MNNNISTESSNQDTFRITTMSKKELRNHYGVSERTFQKWFAVIVLKCKTLFPVKKSKMKNRYTKKKKKATTSKFIHNDRLLSPEQVKAFVKHYGNPSSFITE